jgi:hypothetical protein
VKPRLRSVVLVAALVFAAGSATAAPITVSFTAGDVKSVMAGDGAPLHDDTYQWGLWSIRAMPLVQGGGYTVVGGSVIGVPGDYWAFEAPARYGWTSPYDADIAYFYAKPGSEHYMVPAHPLYMIGDPVAEGYQSYAFDNTTRNPLAPDRSVYKGVCSATDDPVLTGCNHTIVMDNAVQFTFSFVTDPGATWLGWQFVVDGSKYYRLGATPVGYGESRWVADFIGGDADLDSTIFGLGADGGGLPGNVGDGYQVFVPVPEPASLSLVALGLAGAIRMGLRRRPR